jgi:O-acetyl-ADP-ribose deacetylase (regulator of RNase III)/uncharacterized protein YwgA
VIRVLIGDLFASKAQTLVNTVNCVGIMGRGVALEFKEHFPDMYKDYARRCELGEVRLGEPYLYRRASIPWILNFPTKDHWKSVSKLADIVRGLDYLEQHYKQWGIASLAVPPLGCGQGQLEWRVVGPTLYRRLERFEVPIELYAPYGTPHMELEPEFLSASATTTLTPRARVSPSELALVEILSRVEQEPYHWPTGRILFQKLAYFATEAGIPTGLQYRRASFGPFAGQLGKLITKLVNNGLIKEERLGKMFAVKVGPTYRDARIAFEKELAAFDARVDRVADLLVRMRTDQAEVAATVHFVARELSTTQSRKPTEQEVLSEVMRWKSRRKPPLEKPEVAAAIRSLAILRWLDVEPTPGLTVHGEALMEM